MPTIRIDDEVFGALKQRAEAFVDTPNSVLRRVLGLDREAEPPGRFVDPHKQERAAVRASRGDSVSEAEYYLPLLRVLDQSGGAAQSRDVTKAVGDLMRSRLQPADFETLNSGVVRWENRVAFARQRLKDQGLLSADSPHGVWEISEAGRDYLRRNPQA